MEVLAWGVKDLSLSVSGALFADEIVLGSTRREEVEKKVRQDAAYQ